MIQQSKSTIRLRRFGVVQLVCVVAAMLVAVPADAHDGRRSDALELCTGIRGNGNRIFAHFGSLARIVEHSGPVRCAAGGSSGSITTFLVESVNRNPVVDRCGRRSCSATRLAERHALLYRSMAGLTEVGIGADVRTIVGLVERVQAEGIVALLDTDPQSAVAAFVNVLEDFGEIVNPEVFELLAQSPDPAYHVRDLVAGLQDAVGFQVRDSMVFVRVGVINFNVLVELFGRIGDFYAGYGPFDRSGVGAWLDACAAPSRGLTWVDAAALPMPGGSTCGARFAELYRAYETAHRASPPVPSRLDDRIGDRLPMLAVTGVLTGEAITQWQTARAQYFAAEPVTFAPDFGDVRFGYFGRDRDLARIARGLSRRHGDDPVTERFLALGQASWREILGSSPAEPGFEAAVPLSAGVLSVGGWADPLRVQVLDALGARHVVAVNRRGGEQIGGFTPEVSRQLGADDDELARLYSLEDPRSSFVAALRTADAVWCTDWDTPDGFDPAALFADGYSAPMLTSDRFFLRGRNPYPGASPDVAIVGCTPGLTATPPG
jgi:hypothetical protein